MDPYLSVIIPVYNEKGNIKLLDDELKKVLSTISRPFEVIYINDGSTDGSSEVLMSLSGVTVVHMNRNYGQTTAFDVGFKMAKGELIVSMDGDGQNDPNDIPKMIEKLQGENLDVVAGWRKSRKDKNGIKVLNVIGRYLRKIIIADKIHDAGCALRVYRKDAIKGLDIGGEMHRYILALLHWKGFKIGEVEVNHRRRFSGVSNYSYTKAIRGFIDLMYIWFIHKYSQRPLHFFGYLSFIAFAGAIISALTTLYAKIFMDLSATSNGWFFITGFLVLAGIILFSFGIIIDLLIRIHFNNSPYEKRYTIREIAKI